jgi:hypothetical protein
MVELNLPVFVALLTGHLVGDFLLQSRTMAHHKRHLPTLLQHVSIVTGISWLWTGLWWAWWLPLGLWGAHLLLDQVKVVLGDQRLGWFLVDQVGHLLSLVLLSLLLAPSLRLPWQALFPGFLPASILLAGAILAVRFGGFLVGKTVQPLLAELHADGGPRVPGLAGADRWIGMLERGLIFLLVVAGEPGGVGWLLATKGLLRFGEIREPGQRKEAEYILIGTLLSFGWALVVAFATLRLLAVAGGG